MPDVLSPDEFERTLVAVIPAKAAHALSEIYFDATTQVYERLVEETPVDTGYLRAGLQATSDTAAPRTLGARDPNGDYTLEADASAAESVAAFAAAAKTLDNLTIGYVAEYAPYVEDNRHMVKTVRGEWPTIVERAIANQQTAGSGGGTP